MTQENESLKAKLVEVENQYESKVLMLSNREMKESTALQKMLEKQIEDQNAKI